MYIYIYIYIEREREREREREIERVASLLFGGSKFYSRIFHLYGEVIMNSDRPLKYKSL